MLADHFPDPRAMKRTLLILAAAICTTAHTQPAGDAKAAEPYISMCTGCHSIPGYQASFPRVYRVPKIGGQSQQYIEAALKAYRQGDRKHPTMVGVAKGLTDEQIAALRRVYWDEAARHVSLPDGCRLIDKLPLNIVRVPLLWRIFPEAHFILAIRHPCDVTLSCLMQDFGVNDAMVGFTSLETISDIYARVMGAWPAIYLMGSGLFGALFLFGTGEIIDLLIAIEENTRTLRQNNP